MTNTVSIKVESFLREPIILEVKADSEVVNHAGSFLIKLDDASVDIVDDFGGSPDLTEIDGEVWAWLTKAEYDLFTK